MILKPDIKLNRVTDITLPILKKRNITALILDVDNTLSTHHGQVLTQGLDEWLSLMRENGIKLTLLSNSTKRRLTPFAQKIGLDFISLGLKPLPFGYLRAAKHLGVKLKNVAIVGDQIFTDTVGGNLIGINTILLTPIKPEVSPGFKIKRKIERYIIKKLKITDLKED